MLHPRVYAFILMLSLAAALAGCGQTGDLYLPDDNPRQKVKNQS